MSGFSDALYIDLVRSFKVIPRPKPYYNVDEQLTPTAWFEPDRKRSSHTGSTDGC